MKVGPITDHVPVKPEVEKCRLHVVVKRFAEGVKASSSLSTTYVAAADDDVQYVVT